MLAAVSCAGVVEIVQLGEGDWARYRAIRLRSLEDAPEAFWMTTADEEWQPEAFWRRRLRADDRATFLAVDGGHDLGTLGVGPHHDAPADDRPDAGPPQPRESPGGATAASPEAALYGVWVAPQARGGGAAHSLIEAAVRWARDRGFVQLRLEVGDHNERAIAFYRRVGFAPTGRISSFPAPRAHITEHELARRL